MARNTLAKVDVAVAQELLDEGVSVVQIARHFEVAPQAIYDLIKRGRIVRSVPARA